MGSSPALNIRTVVISLLAVLCAATATDAAMAQQQLTPHSAEYRLKISVLGGELNTRLQVSDTGYSATHRIKPTGLAKLLAGGHIEETSEFVWTPDGVVPFHYVSDDAMTRDKLQADINFDWSTGAVTGTVNGELTERILDELAHDRVSIQYELMTDLMQGRLADTYILFDVDRLKTLNVRIVGSKEVKVPAGTYTAIGVQHQAEGSSRVTTLWCVEELDYLPVIIEQHRKGKLKMRATLSRYTPDSLAASEQRQN